MFKSVRNFNCNHVGVDSNDAGQGALVEFIERKEKSILGAHEPCPSQAVQDFEKLWEGRVNTEGPHSAVKQRGREKKGPPDVAPKSFSPQGPLVLCSLSFGVIGLVDVSDVFFFIFFCSGAGEREEASEELAGAGRFLIKSRGGGFRGGGAGGGRAGGTFVGEGWGANFFFFGAEMPTK